MPAIPTSLLLSYQEDATEIGWNPFLFMTSDATDPESLNYVLEVKNGLDAPWYTPNVGWTLQENGQMGVAFPQPLPSNFKSIRFYCRAHVTQAPNLYSNHLGLQFDGTADVTPPTISGVTESDLGDTSVTIYWDVTEDCTNTVDYGLTTSYTDSAAASSGASPLVTLTGLTPGEQYFYRVRSLDANGNAQTETGTFTTTNAVHGSLNLLRTIKGTQGASTIAGVDVDSAGNIVVTGVFSGLVTLGITGQSVQMSSVGGSASSDAFVAKFSPQGAILWHKQLGSTQSDYGHSLVIDSQDNVIVAGRFQGTVDFGGGSLISAGSSDVFVVKYNSAGTHLWSKRFGGTGSDLVEQSNAIAVDASNNIVLGFKFQGTADIGGTQLVSAGSDDCGLVKLAAATGATLWAKRFGSTNIDVLRGVNVDKDGNVLAIGYFFATTDLGGGALTAAGGVNDTDIFLGKYNGTNGNFIWGKRFGGSLGDNGQSVTSDPNTGNIIITGLFKSTVSFGGPAALDSFANGGIFLVGLNSSGNYLWQKASGSGTTADLGLSVHADAGGNLILTGKASSGVYFGGTQTLLGNGQPNFFLASFRINPVTPNVEPAYQWAKMVGEGVDGASQGNQVAFTPTGRVALAGSFLQTIDFGGTRATSQGGYGAGFVAIYSQ